MFNLGDYADKLIVYEDSPVVIVKVRCWMINGGSRPCFMWFVFENAEYDADKNTVIVHVSKDKELFTPYDSFSEEKADKKYGKRRFTIACEGELMILRRKSIQN